MPIRYNINPELNIVLFFGEGLMTGSEFFKAAGLAGHDERRKWGMITIVDVLSAETDFEVEDMHHVIDFTNNLSEKGVEPEQVAVLTHSMGIQLIANTMKLFPSKVPIKFDVFSTLDELITSLGFLEKKREFMQFYNKSKFGE